MEVSDKTWVVGIRGLFKEYINEERAVKLIEHCKKSSDKQLISITGVGLVPTKGLFVIKAALLENEDRVMRGEFKCKYGYWHTKNQECAHAYIRY